MKEEKQTLSETMACSRSVENQSRLSNVCEDRAGCSCLLSPSIFSFFLLSSSGFYPTISRTLADLKLRPERDEGLNIKEHTHTHTHHRESSSLRFCS